MIRSIIFIAFQWICIWSLVRSSCPNPNDIQPCLCSPTKLMIYCEGIDEIPPLMKEKAIGEFETLLIENTNLKTIDKATFSKATFENIFIVGNAKLSSINPEAFIKSESNPTKELIIRKNKSLNGTEIFKVASIFKGSLIIAQFDGNNITSIPADTFSGFPLLEDIRLDRQAKYNIGMDIKMNAFKDLKKLARLDLDGNNITTIEANAINLDSISLDSKSSLIINLNNSNIIITEKNLVSLPSSINNAKVYLNLKDNHGPFILKNDWLSEKATIGVVVFLTLEKAKCICSEASEYVELVKNDDQKLVGVYYHLKCKRKTIEPKPEINLADC